jgi:glutaminase
LRCLVDEISTPIFCSSARRFNSIVSVEQSKKLAGGPEMNALVNPGAITATSMVKGASADEVWGKIMAVHNDCAGRQLKVLDETKKKVFDPAIVPKVLAVMATAGLYDDSGKWLYKTGLPGKSGVGGGLIAVSPGKFGIAVVSPPLDDAGNSVKAQKAIADISNALGGNPYAPTTAKK